MTPVPPVPSAAGAQAPDPDPRSAGPAPEDGPVPSTAAAAPLRGSTAASGGRAALQRLDDAFLPAAGQRLADVTDAAAARWGSLRGRTARWAPRRRRVVRPVASPPPQPARAASGARAGRRGPVRRVVPEAAGGSVPAAPGRGSRWRRWDDRLSGRLGLLADVPQIGYLVIAAVVLVGAVAVLRAHPAASRRTGAVPSGGAAAVTACGLPRAVNGTGYVGPVSGDSVAHYVAQVRSVTRSCALTTPGAVGAALVSFRALLTPAAAATALNGLPVLRLYYRQPDSGAPRAVDVQAAGVAGLRAALASAGAQYLGDAADQTAFAATITPDQDQSQKQLAEDTARADRAAGSALVAGRPSIYAALVLARDQQGDDLATRGVVRAVQLAPVGGSLRGLTVRPLLPSEVTVVGAVPVPTVFFRGGR